MNEQFNQLVLYIRQHLSQGVPESSIRQVLMQYNWSQEMINQAFMYATAPAQPTHIQQFQQPAPQPLQAQSPSAPQTPGKYKVFRALKDTFRATKANFVSFLFVTILCYLLAGALFIFISFIIRHVFYGELGLLFASTTKVLLILFGSLVLYTLWYAFANAIILAATSLAVNDGADGRKSSVKAILVTSVGKVRRVVAANLLFALVTYWPIVLIIFTPIILLSRANSVEATAFILVVPLTLLVAAVWAYIALLRFSLAPYVALFEDSVPVKQTLSRSKHLLTKGGQWFLLKGFLLVAVFLIAIGMATEDNLSELLNSTSVAINGFMIMMSILINGVMVMLYRNRKITRG